jgi:hypothetical protein
MEVVNRPKMAIAPVVLSIQTYSVPFPQSPAKEYYVWFIYASF